MNELNFSERAYKCVRLSNTFVSFFNRRERFDFAHLTFIQYLILNKTSIIFPHYHTLEIRKSLIENVIFLAVNFI